MVLATTAQFRGRDHQFTLRVNQPMSARSALSDSGDECFARTLTERRMIRRVVDLIDEFGESFGQCRVSPGREIARIDGFRDQAMITLRHLRIADQVVNESRFRSPE